MSPWEYKIMSLRVSYYAGPQLLFLSGAEGWEPLFYWDDWVLLRRPLALVPA